MYNNHSDFNDENNLYHYSYRDSSQQPPQEPVQDLKPHKEKKPAPRWAKITAIVLAGAIVSGACGYGGAMLANHASYGSTTITQSSRTASAVTVKKVDGQTAMSPAEVYASTVNSVVSINCSSTSTNIFGQSTESASSGSGFIITSDGYILKVDAKDLTPVTLGDSTNVNVGDTVLAVGNPLGELTFSMSQGIVSCCDRAINVDGTPFNMIQVDASINPGNSGGPLLNLYGEVVGIVSAKYSSYSNTSVEGLGFAIPINDVQTIITDIMENGQVTDKPYLAITAGTMTSQMAAQYQINVSEGVFVYSVEKGGAGDKAGLKLNDTAITSMEDLSAAKKNYKAGDTVTLTVYRDGQEITTQLTFDTQPQTTGSTDSDSQQTTPDSNSGSSGGYNSDLYDYFFGRH